MTVKSDKPEEKAPANKSLLFAIEDVAKLLRTEVKKTESKLKKKATARSSNSRSPNFVNGVEQIARLLRTQVRSASPKKQRKWKVVRKTKEKTK